MTEAFKNMKKLQKCELDIEYYLKIILNRNTKLTHL